jgi:hypothetical protein
MAFVSAYLSGLSCLPGSAGTLRRVYGTRLICGFVPAAARIAPLGHGLCSTEFEGA